MKHSNISIFIPHIGCPHKCSFCDQNTISGAQHLPDGNEVREICTQALSEVKSPEDTEIAFFGGSFTAIPRDYMLELLEAAHEFVGEGKFKGIRCSTRPDCISNEVLSLLKTYGVTAIELGAQSMSDKVLEANERGHTADDVVNASRLIRQYGFELGLQMMIGLYKSTKEDEFDTMNRILAIHPDTVRIYPVVVLKGTRLAELLESGEMRCLSLDDIVGIAAVMLEAFEEDQIKVIKCGLHASEFVEKDMVGGYYHPAFRELCESRIYFRNIMEALEKKSDIADDKYHAENELSKCVEKPVTEHTIAVHPSCMSKAVGHKKSNYLYCLSKGMDIKFVGDESVPKYKCELRR
ncbi:MAG: radical SAM protein [Ruminococcus sp.]|nr:radical SAM protein [Ruminococcus sp.]